MNAQRFKIFMWLIFSFMLGFCIGCVLTESSHAPKFFYAHPLEKFKEAESNSESSAKTLFQLMSTGNSDSAMIEDLKWRAAYWTGAKQAWGRIAEDSVKLKKGYVR